MERRQQKARLEIAVKATHERGREVYGPEKTQRELAEVEVIEAGLHRIKRIRRQQGLRCKQKKKFKATTNSVFTIVNRPHSQSISSCHS